MQKSGVVIINGDNKNNREVIQKINREVKTYGFSKENDYQIDKVRFKEGSTEFILRNKSIILGNFIIKVPGKLNIQNATAAIIAALTAGLTINQIQKGLVLFTGTKRRFELIKEKNDIKLIDDYAHHPSEIQMTLLAAKEWYPGYKIICIFQPHTFSRTKALLSDFSQSFGLSSEVYILPIFPSAREKEDNSINSFILVNETARYHQRVFYAKDHIDLLQKLKNNIKPKTILITMGAGDIYKIHTDLIKLMSYGR
jgi:UDP-N-acetylmuramate--alanine ligase